jgi:hypothetical protein
MNAAHQQLDGVGRHTDDTCNQAIDRLKKERFNLERTDFSLVARPLCRLIQSEFNAIIG